MRRRRLGPSNEKASCISEIERLAHLLQQTFEGKPYYGPSVLGALKDVTAKIAVRKPRWSAHSIWSLLAHLTAELHYARAVLENTAGPWIEGETTWPAGSARGRYASSHAAVFCNKPRRHQ